MNFEFFSVVEFLDYKLVGNIILFINVIICLSYPLNFAIYCGMSRYFIPSILSLRYSLIQSILRQFRTTFRSLFLTPLRVAFCSSSGRADLGEQEATDGVTGNKSRWFV